LAKSASGGETSFGQTKKERDRDRDRGRERERGRGREREGEGERGIVEPSLTHKKA
jgi:hypothetical protein